MADAASQAGDPYSSGAPGLTSGVQGSMNVHRGALLFVFYVEYKVVTIKFINSFSGFKSRIGSGPSASIFFIIFRYLFPK